jgi:hypothetical protein
MIKKKNGFNSIVEFYRLSYFNFEDIFVIDAMHQLLIGVFSTMMDSLSIVNGIFYTKKCERKLITNYCCKLNFPINYNKKIYDYHSTKAFSNLMVLLYGYKIFKFLNKEFYNLLKSLHKIVKIIFSEKIEKNDLIKLEKNIVIFLSKYELNYGKENMNHNIHLINHIKNNILNYGPRLFMNMFKYESFNKDLNRSIKNNNI